MVDRSTDGDLGARRGWRGNGFQRLGPAKYWTGVAVLLVWAFVMYLVLR